MWGKLKTVTQMIAIILVFVDKFDFFEFTRATTSSVKALESSYLVLMSMPEIAFNVIASLMMAISVIATIFSGWSYLKGGKDLLKDIYRSVF